MKHTDRGTDFSAFDLLSRAERLLFHHAFDLTAFAINGVEFTGKRQGLHIVIGDQAPNA